MKRVVIYTREGCGLCETAKQVLLAERERTPFELEEIDVEGSDDLELEYGIRIPVVLVDGVELFEIVVDPDALARALAD
ncbi:MAG TPA: glutaredoxin family protein [Actinomycetota bacterium]|jgi:glutaredoxin